MRKEQLLLLRFRLRDEWCGAQSARQPDSGEAEGRRDRG
jgi:hypothetical protein